MQILYDIFYVVFAVLCFPYLLLKGKAHRGLMQRAGFLPEDVISCEKPIWIHAVSVGEAVVAVKLAEKMKALYPEDPIIISTTTRTGNEMIQKMASRSVDAVFYNPFDISCVVRKVVRRIQPKLYTMIETELWPNLLNEFRSNGILVVLANGRISDASFVNYRRIRALIGPIIAGMDLFCMQTEKDAERIKQLGAASNKVVITGSMKFDDKNERFEERVFSKTSIGFTEDAPVLVAGSTHAPEESIIIDVYEDLKLSHLDLKLVLAPRHPERADAVGALLDKNHLGYQRLSDLLERKTRDEGREARDEERRRSGLPSTSLPSTSLRAGGTGRPRTIYDVLLVDTIGHLKDIYALATVIFIGGSLIKRGGQNPIEAASRKKAVVFGPNMSNFRQVADAFLKAHAAVQVEGISQLKEEIDGLLRDPARRKKIADNARKVIEKNSGAIERTIEEIAKKVKR